MAYRPLRNAPRLAPLISAIGVSLILENAALIHFGNNNVAVPPVFPNARLDLNIVTINWLDIVVIVVTVVLMLALQFLVRRTKIGRAMRSVAQDRDAASLMGVDVDRTIVITFFIGAALAGAAGFIYAMELRTTYFLSGFQLGLIAFTAAVLGGIGNIVGAILGGVVIGLVQALVVVIGNQFPGLQLSRWTEANGAAGAASAREGLARLWRERSDSCLASQFLPSLPKPPAASCAQFSGASASLC